MLVVDHPMLRIHFQQATIIIVLPEKQVEEDKRRAVSSDLRRLSSEGRIQHHLVRFEKRAGGPLQTPPGEGC